MIFSWPLSDIADRCAFCRIESQRSFSSHSVFYLLCFSFFLRHSSPRSASRSANDLHERRKYVFPRIPLSASLRESVKRTVGQDPSERRPLSTFRRSFLIHDDFRWIPHVIDRGTPQPESRWAKNKIRATHLILELQNSADGLADRAAG